MFSTRIVSTDHYLATPLEGLDVCHNEHRASDVYKVPVIRVYGATPAGQKTCMHVHGVFPYLYIPYDGSEPIDRHLRQLAFSIDKALNVALGRAASSTHHVYKVALVSGIPFYGYHPEGETFIKIYLYNPLMVKKLADLLLGGAVMNKVYQPYEAHIPYLLQMFIDYNLYGMNMLNVAAVKFRHPSELDDNKSVAPSSSRRSSLGDSFSSLDGSLLGSCNTTTVQFWDPNDIPSEMWLDPSVSRMSTCELEVDVVAADILNRLEVGANIGSNPGLAALWEDEKQRRREAMDTSHITPPDSPDRGDIPWTVAEAELQDRLQTILHDLQPFIRDSEGEEGEVTPIGTPESQLFPPTPASQVDHHLSRQASVVSSASTVMIDTEEDDRPVINEQSILRVVSSSQSFLADRDVDLNTSQQVSSQDQSLVQLLAALADDDTSPAASQLASQMIALEEQDSILSQNSPRGDSGGSPPHGECDPEDVETLEMSQRIWEQNEGEEPSTEHDREVVEAFDMGGMDRSWNSSQWVDLPASQAGGDIGAVTSVPDSEEEDWGDSIPQLDGPADTRTRSLRSTAMKSATALSPPTRKTGSGNVNKVKDSKSKQLRMKLDLRASAGSFIQKTQPSAEVPSTNVSSTPSFNKEKASTSTTTEKVIEESAKAEDDDIQIISAATGNDQAGKVTSKSTSGSCTFDLRNAMSTAVLDQVSEGSNIPEPPKDTLVRMIAQWAEQADDNPTAMEVATELNISESSEEEDDMDDWDLYYWSKAKSLASDVLITLSDDSNDGEVDTAPKPQSTEVISLLDKESDVSLSEGEIFPEENNGETLDTSGEIFVEGKKDGEVAEEGDGLIKTWTQSSAAAVTISDDDSDDEITQLDGPTDIKQRGRRLGVRGPSKPSAQQMDNSKPALPLGSFSIKAQTFAPTVKTGINEDDKKHVNGGMKDKKQNANRKEPSVSGPVQSKQLNMKFDLRSSSSSFSQETPKFEEVKSVKKAIDKEPGLVFKESKISKLSNTGSGPSKEIKSAEKGAGPKLKYTKEIQNIEKTQASPKRKATKEVKISRKEPTSPKRKSAKEVQNVEKEQTSPKRKPSKQVQIVGEEPTGSKMKSPKGVENVEIKSGKKAEEKRPSSRTKTRSTVDDLRKVKKQTLNLTGAQPMQQKSSKPKQNKLDQSQNKTSDLCDASHKHPDVEAEVKSKTPKQPSEVVAAKSSSQHIEDSADTQPEQVASMPESGENDGPQVPEDAEVQVSKSDTDSSQFRSPIKKMRRPITPPSPALVIKPGTIVLERTCRPGKIKPPVIPNARTFDLRSLVSNAVPQRPTASTKAKMKDWAAAMTSMDNVIYSINKPRTPSTPPVCQYTDAASYPNIEAMMESVERRSGLRTYVPPSGIKKKKVPKNEDIIEHGMITGEEPEKKPAQRIYRKHVSGVVKNESTKDKSIQRDEDEFGPVESGAQNDSVVIELVTGDGTVGGQILVEGHDSAEPVITEILVGMQPETENAETQDTRIQTTEHGQEEMSVAEDQMSQEDSTADNITKNNSKQKVDAEPERNIGKSQKKQKQRRSQDRSLPKDEEPRRPSVEMISEEKSVNSSPDRSNIFSAVSADVSGSHNIYEKKAKAGENTKEKGKKSVDEESAAKITKGLLGFRKNLLSGRTQQELKKFQEKINKTPGSKKTPVVLDDDDNGEAKTSKGITAQQELDMSLKIRKRRRRRRHSSKSSRGHQTTGSEKDASDLEDPDEYIIKGRRDSDSSADSDVSLDLKAHVGAVQKTYEKPKYRVGDNFGAQSNLTSIKPFDDMMSNVERKERVRESGEDEDKEHSRLSVKESKSEPKKNKLSLKKKEMSVEASSPDDSNQAAYIQPVNDSTPPSIKSRGPRSRVRGQTKFRGITGRPSRVPRHKPVADDRMTLITTSPVKYFRGRRKDIMSSSDSEVDCPSEFSNVQVVWEDQEEHDYGQVGRENILLGKLEQSEILELRNQVKREMEHKRKEHIMPLVMQKSKDEIEKEYEQIKQKLMAEIAKEPPMPEYVDSDLEPLDSDSEEEQSDDDSHQGAKQDRVVAATDNKVDKVKDDRPPPLKFSDISSDEDMPQLEPEPAVSTQKSGGEEETNKENLDVDSEQQLLGEERPSPTTEADDDGVTFVIMSQEEAEAQGVIVEPSGIGKHPDLLEIQQTKDQANMGDEIVVIDLDATAAAREQEDRELKNAQETEAKESQELEEESEELVETKCADTTAKRDDGKPTNKIVEQLKTAESKPTKASSRRSSVDMSNDKGDMTELDFSLLEMDTGNEAQLGSLQGDMDTHRQLHTPPITIDSDQNLGDEILITPTKEKEEQKHDDEADHETALFTPSLSQDISGAKAFMEAPSHRESSDQEEQESHSTGTEPETDGSQNADISKDISRKRKKYEQSDHYRFRDKRLFTDYVGSALSKEEVSSSSRSPSGSPKRRGRGRPRKSEVEAERSRSNSTADEEHHQSKKPRKSRSPSPTKSITKAGSSGHHKSHRSHKSSHKETHSTTKAEDSSHHRSRTERSPSPRKPHSSAKVEESGKQITNRLERSPSPRKGHSSSKTGEISRHKNRPERSPSPKKTHSTTKVEDSGRHKTKTTEKSSHESSSPLDYTQLKDKMESPQTLKKISSKLVEDLSSCSEIQMVVKPPAFVMKTINIKDFGILPCAVSLEKLEITGTTVKLSRSRWGRKRRTTSSSDRDSSSERSNQSQSVITDLVTENQEDPMWEAQKQRLAILSEPSRLQTARRQKGPPKRWEDYVIPAGTLPSSPKKLSPKKKIRDPYVRSSCSKKAKKQTEQKKLLDKLSLLHEYTINSYTSKAAESEGQGSVHSEDGSGNNSNMGSGTTSPVPHSQSKDLLTPSYSNDAENDHKTEYDDVMYKLALLSPPEKEQLDKSPPQPASPTQTPLLHQAEELVVDPTDEPRHESAASPSLDFPSNEPSTSQEFLSSTSKASPDNSLAGSSKEGRPYTVKTEVVRLSSGGQSPPADHGVGQSPSADRSPSQLSSRSNSPRELSTPPPDLGPPQIGIESPVDINPADISPPKLDQDAPSSTGHYVPRPLYTSEAGNMDLVSIEGSVSNLEEEPSNLQKSQEKELLSLATGFISPSSGALDGETSPKAAENVPRTREGEVSMSEEESSVHGENAPRILAAVDLMPIAKVEPAKAGPVHVSESVGSVRRSVEARASDGDVDIYEDMEVITSKEDLKGSIMEEYLVDDGYVAMDLSQSKKTEEDSDSKPATKRMKYHVERIEEAPRSPSPPRLSPIKEVPQRSSGAISTVNTASLESPPAPPSPKSPPVTLSPQSPPMSPSPASPSPQSPSAPHSPSPIRSPDPHRARSARPPGHTPAVIPLNIEDPEIQEEVEKARRVKLKKLMEEAPPKAGRHHQKGLLRGKPSVMAVNPEGSQASSPSTKSPGQPSHDQPASTETGSQGSYPGSTSNETVASDGRPERQANSESGSRSDAHTVIQPMQPPPSREALLEAAPQHGLGEYQATDAFCSNPDDVPDRPRDLGGRVLKVASLLVADLPTATTTLSQHGLGYWQDTMVRQRLHSFDQSQASLDDLVQQVQKTPHLRNALFGDRSVLLTPCKPPPSRDTVRVWLKGKEIYRKAKALEQKENKPKQDPEISGKGKGKGKGKSSLRPSKRPSGDVPFNISKDIEPTTERPQEVDEDILTVPESPEDLTDIGKYPVNIPPKILTHKPLSLRRRKSVSFAEALPSKQSATTGLDGSPVASSIRNLDPENSMLDDSDIIASTPVKPSQLLKRLSAQQSQIGPPCTPILKRPERISQDTSPGDDPDLSTSIGLDSEQKISPDCEVSGSGNDPDEGSDDEIIPPTPESLQRSRQRTPVSRRLSTDTEDSLRRVLLTSQLKNQFTTPTTSHDVSQIDGPTPKNTFGFKVCSQNVQDAKALHEYQYLTVMSLELHIETRGDLRPDPEFDAISCMFYSVFNDIPPDKGQRKVTGVMVVDKASAEQMDLIRSCDVSQACSAEGIRPPAQVLAQTLLQKTGITNTDVTYCHTEEELLLKFVDLVRKLDPDMVVGFEIQMLSWGYLIQRASQLGHNIGPQLSRLPEDTKENMKEPDKDSYGADNMSELRIAGRVVLNLWKILRHQVTLNVYTFENLVYHVLHRRVPLFSFRTLKEWFGHRTHLHRWRTIEYYIVRSLGNLELMDKVDLIGQTSEFARVFGIEFYHVLSRGTQYRVESMMLRFAKPMNFVPVSPSVQQRARMRAPECIPLTLEPESKLYTHPLVVLDFQSLYPSIMIAYNYCYSTCLGRLECLSKCNEGQFDFGCTSLNIPPKVLQSLEKDINICPNGVAFVRENIKKGILPRMVGDILKTRLMVKKSMKQYKDDKTLQRLLHARQLGLKLIANVTFGYTSANFSGRMPCVEIGDSIVRKARETLERAIQLVENNPKWGGRVVYGDTDSMFILFEGKTKDQAFKIGQEIADAVTDDNPKPIKLKFEKVYLPCVLQTKKRYLGFMYETPDQKEPVYDAKGIETVRRDSCAAVSKILEKSIKTLFTTQDISLVKRYVKRQCQKLIAGDVSIQDCVFAKEYRGMTGYKPTACVPALEIARNRLSKDRRSEPRNGERVPYVIVYGTPGLPLIQLVREPHELLKDPSLRINATYYITKQILPPLNRMFSLIGVDVDSWYKELPRIIRAVPPSHYTSDNKKGTISQYFTSLSCPVCEETTTQGMCTSCRDDPQRVAIIINSRVQSWQSTYYQLMTVCNNCMSCPDPELPCISQDCPILYRITKAGRDNSQVPHLLQIQKRMLKF